jgi:flavin reductase (DIM6/NTAB) family NADH-FMN oxidoreductase RutF
MGQFAKEKSVDSAAFRTAMGRFATGVAIVAALGEDGPLGFTCQSVVSLSLEPPLLAICPAKTSTSWPRMTSIGRFSVNVLAEDQVAICQTFAQSGGDKFAEIAWHVGSFGTPAIDGAVATIECALELIHEVGDHELVIARVVSFDASEKEPLVYFRSRFASLREHITT